MDGVVLPVVDVSGVRRTVKRRIERAVGPAKVKHGTVTAVDWSTYTLDATIDGETITDIKIMYPYLPATGHEVIVMRTLDGDRVAMGAIERREQAIHMDSEGTWSTNTTFASNDAVWLIGGTLVQDVDAFGNMTVALGLSVGGIWTAWAVGGDAAALDPMNCNLFNPQVNSFQVSLSDHAGVIGNIGVVRIQWGALCWI